MIDHENKNPYSNCCTDFYWFIKLSKQKWKHFFHFGNSVYFYFGKSTFIQSFKLYLLITICSKPIFSASLILLSTRVTGRISPLKPTSAANVILGEMAISSFEERMAQITARSIPGSSTLIPPAIFRKTSFAPSLNPHLFPILQATCSVGVNQILWKSVVVFHRLQN